MISVCIATYNGEKYILEQLTSILIQLDSTDEVIISDDSSADNTIVIIKALNDKRIKLFENQKFANHIKNFEFVLSQAKGDYIFMSDQDDIWMPDKVKISCEYLKKANLVLSDCILIDKNGKEIRKSFFEYAGTKNGLIKNFYRNSYVGCCMAFNQDVLKKALPFPSKILSHDTWIGLVSEIFGKPGLINQPLIKLRRHGENVSALSGVDSLLTLKTSYGLFEILKSRLYLLYSLIRRYFRSKSLN